VLNDRDEYEQMKSNWYQLMGKPLSADWEERQHRIVKDVVRTDRHHPFFGGSHDKERQGLSNQEEEDILLSGKSDPRINTNLVKLKDILMTYVQYLNDIGRYELGYVQGMSDMCSIFLMLQDGDEIQSFWCFIGFMERLVWLTYCLQRVLKN
jgi:hypothetical protein